MAHGKSQFAVWRCTKCNTPIKTTAYNKQNNETITKELKKFCKKCRAHVPAKRKDAKKSS
ncbi:50S ribosomal protein L33 [Candidatus Peregrinibacteria bacterium]|nr:50S ribosomal protein L33 [Candidatus Peregrinibacteria bacterium]